MHSGGLQRSPKISVEPGIAVAGVETIAVRRCIVSVHAHYQRTCVISVTVVMLTFYSLNYERINMRTLRLRLPVWPTGGIIIGRG